MTDKLKRFRLLVVGMQESPKKFAKIDKNGSLRRLNRWMTAIGVRYYSFFNVLSPGDTLSTNNVNSYRLRALTSGYDHILALGEFVSRVLSELGIDHYKLPHPSGLNGSLNDAMFEERIIDECRLYIENY